MKKWVIEGLLFFLYLVFGLCWLAYVPVFGEVQAAFHINQAEGGMLISAVNLANAVVPILAGWLGTRIGLYRAIGLGATLCAAALVTPMIASFPAALLLRFLFGLGGGIVATLMTPMTMRWFAPGSWANINGFNNVSVNIGITLAMYCTLPLSHTWEWRTVLAGYGGVAAVLALLWWACASEGENPEAATVVADVSVLDILKRRETWWFTIGFAGPLGSYLALNTWLAQHLIETRHFTEEQATSLVGYFNLIGLPAAPLGGWFTTWLGLRRPLVLTCGVLLPLATVGLLWAPYPYLWATLVGMVFLFYVAPFFTMPMELPEANPQSVGVMFGAILSLAYLITFGAPVLVGWLKDQSGSCGAGLTLLAVLSMSLAVGGWFLPETGKRPPVEVDLLGSGFSPSELSVRPPRKTN